MVVLLRNMLCMLTKFLSAQVCLWFRGRVGLRRWIKAPISQGAWVRIPPGPARNGGRASSQVLHRSTAGATEGEGVIQRNTCAAGEKRRRQGVRGLALGACSLQSLVPVLPPMPPTWAVAARIGNFMRRRGRFEPSGGGWRRSGLQVSREAELVGLELIDECVVDARWEAGAAPYHPCPPNQRCSAAWWVLPAQAARQNHSTKVEKRRKKPHHGPRPVKICSVSARGAYFSK